jgi:pimeloyl-ACP methyl ester carboxylesterase
MKELFLISGLGADRRVFEFLDLSGYNLNYVDWIPPQLNEPIEDYAQRLRGQIPVENPILIGVSFGGMMAVEIGKLIKTEKIILISSAQTKSEFPWYLSLAARLKIDWLIPASPPLWVLLHLFGIQEKDEKELLANIVRDTDPAFLKWALKKIFSWKNDVCLPNLIRIHGTDDRLFPNRKADYLIPRGGHFMIVTKAAEVSNCIKRSLLKG